MSQSEASIYVTFDFSTSKKMDLTMRKGISVICMCTFMEGIDFDLLIQILDDLDYNTPL